MYVHVQYILVQYAYKDAVQGWTETNHLNWLLESLFTLFTQKKKKKEETRDFILTKISIPLKLLADHTRWRRKEKDRLKASKENKRLESIYMIFSFSLRFRLLKAS